MIPPIRQDPGIECVRPEGACVSSPAKQSLDGYPHHIYRVTIQRLLGGRTYARTVRTRTLNPSMVRRIAGICYPHFDFILG